MKVSNRVKVQVKVHNKEMVKVQERNKVKAKEGYQPSLPHRTLAKSKHWHLLHQQNHTLPFVQRKLRYWKYHHG